jgi:ABC-type sugar transport system substrate-binding protein
MPCYWSGEFAYDATIQALRRDPDIDHIFLSSDNAYLPAVLAALSELGRLVPRGTAGHVGLTSIDGSPKMLDCIRSGIADGSMAQDLYKMGEIASARAHEAALNHTINAGTIWIPPIRVTSENVEDPQLWGNILVSKLSDSSFTADSSGEKYDVSVPSTASSSS